MIFAASYLGCPAVTSLGPGWGAPVVAAVSVVRTIGEIIYAGSATALAPTPVRGRAPARLQISTGFGRAVSPAAITTLASHGPAALWGSLTAATLLSTTAVATERAPDQRLRRWSTSADRVLPIWGETLCRNDPSGSPVAIVGIVLRTAALCLFRTDSEEDRDLTERS